MKFCLAAPRHTSVSSFCILPSPFSSPGGEIESRLAYTQKSEGQNLSGRPAFALPGYGSAGPLTSDSIRSTLSPGDSLELLPQSFATGGIDHLHMRDPA
jgi:hypothetical protein